MRLVPVYRSIEICGYEYQVKLDQTFADLGCMGDSDSTRLIIRIANDLPPAQQVSTLIHEILEAIKAHHELDSIDHSTLCTIEVALNDVFNRAGIDLSKMLKTSDGG